MDRNRLKKWQQNFKGKFEKLHSWIFNHPQVVNPPLTNDHGNTKKNTTGEVIKQKSGFFKYQSENFTTTE